MSAMSLAGSSCASGSAADAALLAEESALARFRLQEELTRYFKEDALLANAKKCAVLCKKNGVMSLTDFAGLEPGELSELLETMKVCLRASACGASMVMVTVRCNQGRGLCVCVCGLCGISAEPSTRDAGCVCVCVCVWSVR